MNETRIGSLGKVKVFSNIVIDNRKLKREPPGFKQHSFSKRAKATKTWILAWETPERGSRMHNSSPGRFSLALEVWSHLQGQSQGKRPGDEVVGRTMTTCSIFRANVRFDCLQFSREQKRKTTILPDVSKHLLRKSGCHKYVFNFLSCKSIKKENWGVSWCNLRKLMFVSYDVVTWNWLLVWVF